MASPRPTTPREAFAAARTPSTVVARSVSGLDWVTDPAGVPAGSTSGGATGGNDGEGRAAWLALGGVGAAVGEGAGTAVFLAGTGAVVLAGGGVIAAGVGAAGVGAGTGGVVRLHRTLPEPVQNLLRDLAPAMVDGERVAAVGELPEVGDRG